MHVCWNRTTCALALPSLPGERLEAIHKQQERAREAAEMVETFCALNQPSASLPSVSSLFTTHESVEVSHHSSFISISTAT